jgi:serine/threonine protein kinase
LKELHGRPLGASYRAETAYETEANALNEISALNHPRLLSRIAAFTRGEKYYFIFRWADGGSLRDFWRDSEMDQPARLCGASVKEVLYQLRGLADALCALHNFKGSESWRRGDLKPENILRFRNPTDSVRLGVLQIADLVRRTRRGLTTMLAWSLPTM